MLLITNQVIWSTLDSDLPQWINFEKIPESTIIEESTVLSNEIKGGITLFSDGNIKANGDFQVKTILITSESDFGGNENVFQIEQGMFILKNAEIASALDMINAKRVGQDQLEFGLPDNRQCIEMNTVPGLQQLCRAAKAWARPEIEKKFLVQIGFPKLQDPDPQFPGTPILYEVGASIWGILRGLCDGFDHRDRPGFDYGVTRIPIDIENGPFARMPRILRTRADLADVGEFRHLEQDKAGNPKVYLHNFRHEDCAGDKGYSDPAWNAPGINRTMSCPCMTCGHSVLSHSSQWIGPMLPELYSLWLNLPESRQSDITPEPDTAPERDTDTNSETDIISEPDTVSEHNTVSERDAASEHDTASVPHF